MNRIRDIFIKYGGYVKMKDLKEASVQTRDIKRLLTEGEIEKIKPGLYKLADLTEKDGVSISFIDICHAVPNGVICLLSALEFYNLTTFIPSEVYVAIPNSGKPPQIQYPPTRFYYFRDSFYQCGIETISTSFGNVKIYNREKTICDMFRYRKKLGEDVALEGLNNYIKTTEANIKILHDYAEKCHVKTILTPYLKAMLA